MKTILITGCSTGIGQALAQAFLKNGDRVIATARRLDSLNELKNAGAFIIKLDVTDEQSIANVRAEITQEFGHLDMLINNAGIAAMGPLADLPTDELRKQFETNCVAPIAVLQSMLGLLEKSAAPIIVNVGSVSGILTTPFAGAYCASKAAINSLNDALRMELTPLGIQVVNIQPGKIKSALGDNASEAVGNWLKPTSRYWSLKDAIYARATAQQNGATTAQEMAAECVTELSRAKPRPIIRVGNQSRIIPLMERWVPIARLDKMLSKMFSLDQMGKTSS